jgi:RHS repeat-associated protein
MGIKPLDYEPEGSSRWKYNGKELDEETNLYDYEARSVDMQLGRFTGIDPHATHYYHSTPYAYVESNPISRIDPDGKNWEITSKKGKDGKVHFNIKFSGKIVDDRGKASDKELDAYAARLTKSMQKAFSGKSKNAVWSVEVDIKRGESEGKNKVKDTDHVFRIVADGDVPDPNNPNAAGYSEFGSQAVYLNERILGNKPNGESGLSSNGEATLERTGAHEAGHTAWLLHPGDRKGSGNQGDPNYGRAFTVPESRISSFNSGRNLMYQSRKQNKAGQKLIDSQIRVMKERLNAGDLNNGKQK